VATTLGVRELGGPGVRRLALHLAARDPGHLAMLGVDASRAQVFGVAIVVLASLVEVLGAPSMRVSPGGLRQGIVLREVKSRGAASPRTRAA
jgi:exopolyphosphatase/pppGpp-phosphohydrolase